MSISPRDASVLIVEDNPDNLFVMELLLREDLGIKYYNARASGRQLFKLLEANPNLTPHLVLLDLQLPYEDGYGVLAKIRELPRLRETKVAAVTANVMPQDVEKARGAGFDGFIGKPINRHRFPEQIQRLLNGESVWEPY
ncbi:MAG TPA: response regulator [Herpetosiphonaceae bacterium]